MQRDTSCKQIQCVLFCQYSTILYRSILSLNVSETQLSSKISVENLSSIHRAYNSDRFPSRDGRQNAACSIFVFILRPPPPPLPPVCAPFPHYRVVFIFEPLPPVHYNNVVFVLKAKREITAEPRGARLRF